MGYRYPNGAFSVILDIPGNPFAQYGSIDINHMADRAMHLERTLSQAKQDLSKQIIQQKEVYNNIDSYLKKINPLASLKELLNPSVNASQQDISINEIAPTLEEYRTKLNHLLFEYKSKYIAYFGQRTINNHNALDTEIFNLIQLTYKKIGTLKQEVQQSLDKRIAKINAVNSKVQTPYYDIHGLGSSEIKINDVLATNPNPKLMEKLTEIIRQIIGPKPNLKDFSRYNSAKNLVPVRKKQEKYQSAFQIQQQLIQNFMNANAVPYEVASKIITILLKKELGFDIKDSFQWNPYSQNSISSASGDLFEFSGNFDFQERLSTMLNNKNNLAKLWTGGVITEETRFIAQTNHSKTKESQKKFEQTKAKLSQAHQELLNYFDDNLKLIPKKDKIDDYIILHDDKNSSTAKYILAFSDKLKYAADNVNIIGNEHQNKENISSSFLTTMDLLSSLTSSQEGFIFAILNGSPVSAFSDYASKYSQQIERIFISLIYDLAYNPNNFTSYIKQTYQSLDFSNTQTLYLHRTGPKIIPSFEILESTLNMLIALEHNLITAEPINVSIYYSSLSLNDLYDEEAYGKAKPAEKIAQWNNVARQVAESIKLQVIMNLSPILFDMEKIRNTF